jgi:hypothetical protein
VIRDPRIHRRLIASWPNHEEIAEPAHQMLMKQMISDALPVQIEAFDIALISSRRKRWDVLSLPDYNNRVIVADLSYSYMIKTIDMIIQQNPLSDANVRILARSLLAWALFTVGEYDRASVLAGNVALKGIGLDNFPEPQDLGTYLDPDLFLFTLLHEAAHVIVDGDGGSLAQEAREYASASLRNMSKKWNEVIEKTSKIGTKRKLADDVP